MFRVHKDALVHNAGDHRCTYVVSEAYISDSSLVLQVYKDSLFKLCWTVVV
jgi:hypothetical protein